MTERITDKLINSQGEPASIDQALRRGVAQDEQGFSMILPDRKSLEQAMRERELKLYLGIDPTSSELHIGHTVPLRKLKHLQDLGHKVNLLFGTFTGMIGDPSDKSAARVRLTKEQIDHNVADYREQAGRILDLSEDSPNPVKVVYNHEWLGPLNFEDVVNLASNFTVQQMLERSMFRDRIRDGRPVYLHEFLYPLMQGYDSVALDVDIEVGGKDQIFNMLVGRDLMKAVKGKEKWVLPTKLIEDPSGKKMGKTEGNIVNIRDLPEIKYEGIMTWPDTAIALGFELVTSVPVEDIHTLSEMLANGEINPMEAKEALAYRVVAELDGVEAAEYASEEFTRVKRMGQLPRRMPTVAITRETTLASLLVTSGLVKSEAEALSRISTRSVFIDGVNVNSNATWPESAQVVSIGKKTIKNARKIEIV